MESNSVEFKCHICNKYYKSKNSLGIIVLISWQNNAK